MDWRILQLANQSESLGALGPSWSFCCAAYIPHPCGHVCCYQVIQQQGDIRVRLGLRALVCVCLHSIKFKCLVYPVSLLVLGSSWLGWSYDICIWSLLLLVFVRHKNPPPHTTGTHSGSTWSSLMCWYLMECTSSSWWNWCWSNTHGVDQAHTGLIILELSWGS